MTIAEREEEPKLNDLAICSQIVDREPDDTGANFPVKEGVLYCWASVRNQHSEPTELTVVWRYNGKELTRQTMDVGVSRRWRSWARRRINPKRSGEWSCEILDAQGESPGKSVVTLK